jgi:feruloyl esterase
MPLPAFCRVEATARPTADSEIKFEVWIPPANEWNGKFQGVGNGGYQGSVTYTAMATALRKGYATASTDTGHAGDDMKFGQGHPEKIVDYAHRAIHVMTETSKLIVRDAQGRFADKSYFVGCSAGGKQALSEAQRYPEDYDGIVAGIRNNPLRQTFGSLYSWMATHTKDGAPIFTPAKLALLSKSAVDACDAIDGLKDGLIDDPRKCHFDPAKLLCPSTGALATGQASRDDDKCLTQPQVDAAKKMYDGLKSPKTGELIYTGWPRGSEGFGDNESQSWRQYITDQKEPARVDFFRYFLFHDPNWDYRSIDWDRDLAYAEQKMPFFPSIDRDLSAFKKHGGKLVMYTGWMDTVVPPQDTVAYYEGVRKTMGGIDRPPAFYRFFMAPGMPLRRWTGTEHVRRARRARAVGRKRHGARQADRHAQHERQSRSHAPALHVSAGRALQRHRQQRRGRQLFVCERVDDRSRAQDDHGRNTLGSRFQVPGSRFQVLGSRFMGRSSNVPARPTRRPSS